MLMKFALAIFTFLSLHAEAAEHMAGGPIHIPKNVLYQFINVTILLVLMYVLTKEKVRTYFTSRVEEHSKAKIDAAKAFEAAQKDHHEVVQKLKTLQAEESKAVEKAQVEAMELKSKLIREAELLAKNIVEDSKKTAHYEYEKAKQVLRSETLDAALKTARESIQKNMTKEDQHHLEKQFIDNIGTVQ